MTVRGYWPQLATCRQVVHSISKEFSHTYVGTPIRSSTYETSVLSRLKQHVMTVKSAYRSFNISFG